MYLYNGLIIYLLNVFMTCEFVVFDIYLLVLVIVWEHREWYGINRARGLA